MTTKSLMSLSKEGFKSFIKSFDVVLSDCDGVLWKENEVIPGSPQTVAKFKELGKKFIYVTNNNTKTRSEFVEKCNGLGYKASVDDIICTSFLAAEYLKEKNFTQKAYIIGSAAIGKELEALGLQHCGIGIDLMEGSELDLINEFLPSPEVGAVIVGFDKYFSFPKIMKAATYLSNPDIHFIATNTDAVRPSLNSNIFPGCGCFVKAIEAVTNRSPVILGKPEQFLTEYIIKKYNISPERTLMIGDNCTTDILLGTRCGFKTLLVLSGVTTKSDVDSIEIAHENNADIAIPDYYTNQLKDIFDMLAL